MPDEFGGIEVDETDEFGGVAIAEEPQQIGGLLPEESERLSRELASQNESQRNIRAMTGGSWFSPGGPEMDFARALYLDVPAKIGEGLQTVMKPVEEVAAPLLSATTGAGLLRLATGGGAYEPGKSIIPGLEPSPEAAGVIPSVRRAAAGMTTPGSIAVLPFAAGETIPAKLVQGAFAGGAAAAIPGSLEKLATAKTPAETRGALTDIGLEALMAGLAGSQAIRPRTVPEGPIRLEDRGDVIRQMEERYRLERQLAEGSPFVRREVPPELTLPPEMQGPPFARPITMGVEQGKLPTLGAEPTFEPSGLEVPTGFQTVEQFKQIGGEPSAVQRETTPVLRDVRQPEVTQEGQVQVPVSPRVAETAEARVTPTLESDKALYQDISSRMLQLIREGKAVSPLMEVLKGELEVVKNRHGGMPPGQTSPARKTIQAQQEAMKADAANELAPAVRIGGRVISDPNKGHIQMALEIGGPEAIGDVSNPANQGFLYKGEFISREAASKLIGEETPLTSERLREIRQQKKGGEIPSEETQRQKEVLEPESTVEGVTALDPRTGSPLSATESLINRLESMKYPETGETPRLYTLRPDILQKVGKQTWNDALSFAQGVIRSGRSISEAINSAIEYIRKFKTDFDESAVRTELAAQLEGQQPPARLGMATQPSESRTYPVEGESVAMRKSAERATTSEMIPEPVQEQIRTAPESFYRQQSMARVEDAVSGMSDSELVGVPRDSNLYTAAKLEQSRRLFERGENEAGYNVFVELEKEGTRLGQLINQFKLLKGTRAEDVVRVINNTLKKAGKDVLTKTQQDQAIEIASKSKDADSTLAKATDAWRKEPTLENAKAAEQALLDSTQKGLDLQRFIGRYQPRSVAGIIKSVLQGNLLTPISEVANIVGNVSFLPFRVLDRTVASTFDVLDSYLTGGKREITVQPIRGPVEAAKGLARGAQKIPDIFLRGTGDVIKGETRAGLHPIKAWINQFSSNPELPTTGGKLTLSDRIGLAIEGTFGVPAEAMLRGLGAGDVAFREAAQARATATELRLANVPRNQWSFAQKFPELFLDKAALERIQTDTMQSVFQRSSKTLNVITNWIRGRGDWFDLAVATVAPYKLTPWNIVGEILSYNPLVAFGRSVYDFKSGNRRGAKLNAGKYVVGSMLTAAGWWLYKNGLMSPSLDQRDEAQKARILAGEVLPPNHINLSGLKRALAGGDPSFKKGDETADVFRAGGLAGSMFYMTANIGREFERNPEVGESDIWGAIIRQSTLEQARFGMNQSFLSGVEGLLGAIREGNTDNYVRKWANTVASVPMPNSLTVLSRATREYKPDFREDTFKKQVENIVRNRLGFANMDDYLPLKRGLWGEPLRETPKDRNALVYHFFDVFKNKQVTDDPVALELFKLWRETGDTRVIPSLPEKSLTIGGNTYQLNAAQQSRYAELVGTARRRITDAVSVNPQFHQLTNEKKIDLLDRVYRAGLDQGKAQFWKEIGGAAALTPKPERAGFKSPPGRRQ